MVNLTAYIETKLNESTTDLATALRLLSRNWQAEEWASELCATALVVADLVDQGWSVRPDGHRIFLSPPGLRTDDETAVGAKERLRRSLQIGQDRQLSSPSVHAFVNRFSRTSHNHGHRSSILDLVDSGADLAAKLRRVGMLDDGDALDSLRSVFDPELESFDETTRCSETGIRLMDVWRYFRHTWSLEYRSIPGRQVPILIRNRARAGRPVIGIALLASPVLRTKPRDAWIGWTPESFLERVNSGTWDATDALRALADRIDINIADIRSDDLALPIELACPTERVIFRLEQRSAGAAAARELQLQSAYSDDLQEHGSARSQGDPVKRGVENIDWLSASNDLLFVRKRAETLAKLLAAKRHFLGLDWRQSGRGLVSQMMISSNGYKALSTALQEVRKAGLSSQVADLSICGAVAPYNVLLGGKLIALAVTSNEVRKIWRERYTSQVSIISSQMAGRPIKRSADLKILTTTSLYGSGSSQYNRLRLEANSIDNLKTDIRWIELDRTAGYGTVHLSTETVRALRTLSENEHLARRINNRFGEGTSPRLRQVREGLDVLGINSDDVLHHATPRLFYACALEENARERLLGLMPDEPESSSGLAAIAEAWRRRWLLPRIRKADVLDRLEALGPEAVRSQLVRNAVVSGDAPSELVDDNLPCLRKGADGKA